MRDLWPFQSSSKILQIQGLPCNSCGEKGNLSTACIQGKKEIKNNTTQNKFLFNNDDDDETVKL